MTNQIKLFFRFKTGLTRDYCSPAVTTSELPDSV